MEKVQVFNKSISETNLMAKQSSVSKPPKYGSVFLDHDGKYYKSFRYTGKNFVLISGHLSRVLKEGCQFELNKDGSIHVTRSDGVNHCMTLPKGCFLVHEAILDEERKNSVRYHFKRKFKVLSKKYFSGKSSSMFEYLAYFEEKYI